MPNHLIECIILTRMIEELNTEDIEKLMDSKQAKDQTQEERMQVLKYRLSKIKHKIAIISGKGGVGKSTTAVNIAAALAERNLNVGILDVDITGPNIPKMLGMEGKRPEINAARKTFYPVKGPLNIKVVSMAFLLGSSDEPVIWRGPMKMGVVRQFLGEAEWGDLDYLIIDLPPGTGDEILDIMQLISDSYIIIVSTPQAVALSDARKTFKMAQKMQHEILGFVENMSSFICPDCNSEHKIFGEGGVEQASADFETEVLGKIPIEPLVREYGDNGTPIVVKSPETKSAKAFRSIVDKIQEYIER